MPLISWYRIMSSPAAPRRNDLARVLSFSTPNVNVVYTGSPTASPSAANLHSPAVDSPRTYQRHMTSKKREIKRLNAAIGHQDVALTEANQTIEELKIKLKEQTKGCLFAKRQLASLTKEKEDLEKLFTEELGKLTAERDDLKQKIHAQKVLIAEQNEWKSDLDLSYVEMEKIQKEIDVATKARQKVEEKLTAERDKMRELGSRWMQERAGLEQQISTRDATIRELTDEIDILLSGMEMERKEKFETACKLAPLEAKIQDLEAQLNKSQQTCAERYGQLEMERSGNKQLQNHNDQLTGMLDEMRTKCTQLTDTLDEQQQNEILKEAQFKEELLKKDKEINDLCISRANCRCRVQAHSRQFSIPQSPSVLSLSSNITTRSTESALSFESAKKMGFNTDCDDEPMVLENNRIASGTIVVSEVPTFKRPLTPIKPLKLCFNNSVVNDSDFNPSFQQDFLRDSKRFRGNNGCDSPSRMEQERLEEIQRRNSLVPANMRSSYPIETQVVCDNKLSEDIVKYNIPVTFTLPAKTVSKAKLPAPKSPNSTPVAPQVPMNARNQTEPETPGSKGSAKRFNFFNRRSIASPNSSTKGETKENKPVQKSVAFVVAIDSGAPHVTAMQRFMNRKKKQAQAKPQS